MSEYHKACEDDRPFQFARPPGSQILWTVELVHQSVSIIDCFICYTFRPGWQPDLS